MASGRRSRGSRHRCHRHKQQKGEDSGDSDAEQNLRHGPNPNPNPSSSSPWAMEPLPPNVEGPSLLKQPPDAADPVDRGSPQAGFAKRRKENMAVAGDAASVMDRWDGGGGADEAATLALLGVSERGFNVPADSFVSWREPRGESEPKATKGKCKAMSAVANNKGTELPGSNAFDSNAQTSGGTDILRDSRSEGYIESSSNCTGAHMSAFDGSEQTKGRISKSLLKDREFENAVSSATMLMEMDKKRARRGDLSQKPKKFEGIGDNESRDDHHGIAEKGVTRVFQDVTRNIQLEKELDSRIRRRNEGSGDKGKWRDGGKEKDVKGSHLYNEEHFQAEGRLKDEKSRPEKMKEDFVKSRRERSTSRHREDNWKSYRHVEDKSKEESLAVSGGREVWGKYDRDYELKRKSDKVRGDRTFELKAKDEKLEVLIPKDDRKDLKNRDIYKDFNEKEGQSAEGKHKESRSKDSKHRDEKDKDGRFKAEGSAGEDRKPISESVKKDNQQKEQRHVVEIHLQDEGKAALDRPKDDKLRVKGKLEDIDKDSREKLEKHRDDGAAHSKYKKRTETEQEDATRYRDGPGVDVVAARKRFERDQDLNVRYNKRLIEEIGFERRHDDKDTYERQKIDTQSQRENQKDNGKQTESLLQHEKSHALNDRDRDAWVSGERGGREKVKDDLSRQHNKRRDESQERRWGGAFQEEVFKQKHSRELEERQRFTFLNVGKQRGDRGKDDRKQIDKLKEERYDDAPIPVFERLGGAKEINRWSDGGDKDMRRMSSDKFYDQFGMKGKDFDGQSKSKGLRDPVDTREIKVHVTNKGDRTATAKTSRAASSQDQERVLSAMGAKDASTSENLSKRIVDSNMFDSATGANRARGRHAEDMLHGDRALHEKIGRKSKFEASVSSSSGTRWARDQSWHMMSHGDQGKGFSGPDEEARSWEPKVSNQDSDDERRRSYSHERIRDTSSPRGINRGLDDYGRDSDPMLLKDSSVSKRKHESFTQSAAGPAKHRRLDDTGAERPDWSHQGIQLNRAPLDGPMARSLPPNRHLGSSPLLPPPPPYRPGVDNPTVMGISGSFAEGSNGRDAGRYDRKAGSSHSRRSEMVGPGDTWGGFGMGSWNAHNQGPVPGPGGMFPSFHQMAPGFLGMGQQFHVPQVFGPNGSRPVNMGFGGRFRMGDGGSGFPGHASDHGPAIGWHRFSDGSEGHRPLSGFMHVWEGSVRYTDDRQRFGHPDWDQFSQGMPGVGWDNVSEPWQARVGEECFNMNTTHRQIEESHKERMGEIPWRESEMEKNQNMEDSTLDTIETSHVCANKVIENFTGKASKQFKERLKKLLLFANVQANLVDAELYREYLGWLPPCEAEKGGASAGGCHMDDSKSFIDQDLEFEAVKGLQDIMPNENCPAILSPLPQNAFEDALKVFQRPVDRIQKSKFGSFILPRAISGRLRPSFSTGSAKVDAAVDMPDKQSPSPASGCSNFSESRAAKEVDAKCSEDGIPNTAESFTDESDSARIAGDTIDSGIAGMSVLVDEIHLPFQQGHEQSSLTKTERKMSTESISASEVADNSDWMDQNGVSLANHVEAPELIEREQVTYQDLDVPRLTAQTSTFSGKEKENLGESFEISGAIIIDGRKGTHRQEVYVDTAVGSLP